MPVPNTREAVESPLDQGASEKRAYRFDFTNLGTTAPLNATCQLWDVTDGASWADVSGAKLTGTASISGSYVTSKIVQSLVAGRVYRLEVEADDAGGGHYEGFVILYGTA